MTMDRTLTITAVKYAPPGAAAIRRGMTADGYTTTQGVPCRDLIQIEGSRVWRRPYLVQTSNAGSVFVRVGGRKYWLDSAHVEIGARFRKIGG